MLPSNDEPSVAPHFRLRIAALIVIFVIVLGALVSVVAGNGVLSPPAPPTRASASPGPSVVLVLPSDWYIPPSLSASSSPVPSPTGNSSLTPGTPINLPSSVAVTASAGSRYGEVWSFEPVLPADYQLDTAAVCRWSMQLADGRAVSTAGSASDSFCGAWRVTVPYVPPVDRPSDYPVVVTLEISGRDAAGQTVQVTSSPYKVTPLDGSLSPAFVESNLALLWLDASSSFDADGKAQLRLHWLGLVSGAIDSITTEPTGVQITTVAGQAYEVDANNQVAPDGDAVVTVIARDPGLNTSVLSAKLTIHQPSF